MLYVIRMAACVCAVSCGCGRTDKREDRVEVGYKQLAEASSIAEVSGLVSRFLGVLRTSLFVPFSWRVF